MNGVMTERFVLPAIIHHPDLSIPLPEHHRFPMGKFTALMQVLGEQGLIGHDNLFQAQEAPVDWLKLAHETKYVDGMISGQQDRSVMRRIGLPWSPQLVRRSRLSSGGTVLCARLALARGIACHTAGGSHHANAGSGAGYCVFNDVAIAIHLLLAEGAISRASVIDLDVHQGDGTARIFAQRPEVYTFSMHAENNFPGDKATSDLDIGLDDKTGDADYLAQLERHLEPVLVRSKPDLVFYLAGVDPHEHDLLGRLSLTARGLARRDEMVIRTVRQMNIPLACVLGGGYAKDVMALARLHAQLHKAAAIHG